MDIGYGFVRGLNRVKKEKILQWLHCDSICWKAFLWYITQYVEVTDFTDEEMTVKLLTSKQREFFYKRVMNYGSIYIIEEDNYEVDKHDDLWIDHHGGNTSQEILEKILE